MKKISDFAKKHRVALAFALVMLTLAAVFGRVGALTLGQASQRSERRIINDDYDSLTGDITEEGITRHIGVKAGQEIYGVNLLINTYDRIQYGELRVELWDGDTLLGSCREKMEYLLNDTFKSFLLPEPVKPREDSGYILRIYRASGRGTVRLWKSRKSYAGFEIEGEEGTPALQYVTDHTGKYIYKFYYIIFAAAALGAAAAFFALFSPGAKLEAGVFAAVLAGGVVFALFTPAGAAPDEYLHIATAYDMTEPIFMDETVEGLYMRRSDFERYSDKPSEYDLFRMKDTRRGLFKKVENDRITWRWRNTRHVFKPMYFARALGMSAARRAGFNYLTVIFAGRLGNLLMYAFLASLAVRKAPGFKGLFAVAALLPMNLQLAGSFCYDAYVNGLSLLFAALTLELIFTDKKALTLKDAAPLALVFALLAPAKTVYVLMGAMALAIPGGKFRDRKTALKRKAAVIAAGVALWALSDLSLVTAALKPHDAPLPQRSAGAAVVRPREEGLRYPYDIFLESLPREPVPQSPDPDILPNGDSRFYFSPGYIIKHPRRTAKLLAGTFLTLQDRYISSMLGTRLGEIILTDLTASDIFLLALVFALFFGAAGREGDRAKLPPGTKAVFLLTALAVFAAVTLACVMWTPTNYDRIFGIQGRYFLPVLVPALAALRGGGILTVKKDLSRFLAFGTFAAGIGIVLNVFMIVCGIA